MLGVIAVFITALGKGVFATLTLLPRWEELARRESVVIPRWNLGGLERFIIQGLVRFGPQTSKRKGEG